MFSLYKAAFAVKNVYLLVASLPAGASVVCTRGVDAPQFLPWLADFHPMWYTAVPTMHQAILRRATQARDGMGQTRLRFVRSCSAPLPPQVMGEYWSVTSTHR
jgi:oxalate---CoA ligase